VLTVRRQADEIMRLKSQGVRPSEIAIRLGIGRASVNRVLDGQHGGDMRLHKSKVARDFNPNVGCQLLSRVRTASEEKKPILV
jgi:hypothetical protein